MAIKSKLFRDILRDKGSSKYSITKALALAFATFLIVYMVLYLFILQKELDHTIVLELLGAVGTLVGLKNNWGAGKSPDTKIITRVPEAKSNTTPKSDDAVF